MQEPFDDDVLFKFNTLQLLSGWIATNFCINDKIVKNSRYDVLSRI